jgi:Flp pilus assembly pilin Flp
VGRFACEKEQRMLWRNDWMAESRRLFWAGAGIMTRSWTDRRGVTAVEYAIIVGVMVSALVLSMPLIGKNLSNIFVAVSAPL